MAARTRLLERVALIAQEKLNQPERALKAYERILATDPRNRSAALALLPLYRNAQKWPRLLATYEVLLGPASAGDGMADKLELYAEARKICEQRLGSKALAFQWCARAFEAAPEERGGAHGSGTAGRRGRRVGQPGGAVRRAHGGVDRRRGAAVAAAADAAHRRHAAVPAAGRAQGGRADRRRARLRRGGRRRAGADPDPDQGLGGSRPSCCTRAPTARPTPPSAFACCSASRSSRKSASSTRPPRRSPGRRSWRRSRPTSARCGR